MYKQDTLFSILRFIEFSGYVISWLTFFLSKKTFWRRSECIGINTYFFMSESKYVFSYDFKNCFTECNLLLMVINFFHSQCNILSENEIIKRKKKMLCWNELSFKFILFFCFFFLCSFFPSTLNWFQADNSRKKDFFKNGQFFTFSFYSINQLFTPKSNDSQR